jgi:hypothetical protein
MIIQGRKRSAGAGTICEGGLHGLEERLTAKTEGSSRPVAVPPRDKISCESDVN